MRAGRSVKQTVTGLTPRKTSFPWLKLTFFAFCTKRTSTFFDCLPPAVQVISAFSLGAGAGDWAYAMNRVAIMMAGNAPNITMSLVIFIGLVCCGFGSSFVFLCLFVWLFWLSQLKPCPGEK